MLAAIARSAAIGLHAAILACGRPSTPVVEDAPQPESRPAAQIGAEDGDDPDPPADPRPDVGTTPAAPPELPPTTLALTLLATQVPDDPKAARATIRDHAAGTIAHYQPGDPIGEAAIVVAIERGRVILVHDEQRERLDVGQAIARIEATDVFYTDLVDDALDDSIDKGVQLESGPGWIVKTPAFAWGTPRTVHRLREAIRAYVRVADGGPDVHVGDISKSGGGPFPPHLSHRAGRDVDIAYVLRGSDADVLRFLTATPRNLDATRSWKLVRALLETRAVGWIFMDYDVQRLLHAEATRAGATADQLDTWFQYPHGDRAMHGIIRDWRGHDDHFHVRFLP